MTDPERLDRSVLDHEGFVEHPYKDTRGLWTFGIGRCLETNPLTAEEWRFLLDHGDLTLSISNAGSLWLMRREIQACEMECQRLFSFWPALNAARQNVLVEMAYQIGTGGLAKFVNMLDAIYAGDFDTAAEQGMNSKWARSDSPRRAQQLMKQLRLGEFPVLGGSNVR